MDGDLSLAELGEFPMIDRIVAGRRQPAGVLLGPGDDAAVVSAPDARVAVSTDMLVEGRHFRLDWSSPHDLGRKAIAQNAADIEAMGASVTSFVVAFGAPAQTPAARVQELADGMWFEAGPLGAGIAGGDLVCSPQWVVSVTALGDLAGRPPVRRSRAKAGTHIAVAGHLGRSAAGLALWQNDIAGFDELRKHHLVPRPPYGQGVAAAEAGALAMTDVSDGLLADLGHIARASGVVIDVRADALQSDIDVVAAAAQACGADPRAFVLCGGEDHALVACFDGAVPEGWRVIGHVGEGTPAVLVDGRPWTGSTGWQSFD
ncbi:MAG: thiamine-phosphate kinase [Mycobacterium sp.]